MSHKTSENIYSGISDTERVRRVESNSITTKINFGAWVFEVVRINIKTLNLLKLLMFHC